MKEFKNLDFLFPHPTIKMKYAYRVLKNAREVEGREGLTAVLVRSQGALFCIFADITMSIIDPSEIPCTLAATLPPCDEI